MAALTARSLTITVDGTEFAAQVFAASVDADDAESDSVTFAEAAAGGARAYTLAITLTQDMAASTLWTMIWDQAGEDVPVVMKPYGNVAPSVGQPHFTMTVSVREPNGTIIGGEADANPLTRFNVEVEWPLLSKPIRVVA
jgi:hypothetical protein